MKKKIVYGIFILLFFSITFYYLFPSNIIVGAKPAIYTRGKLKEPKLSYSPPMYEYQEENFQRPEYTLPLSQLPENYQRDIVTKFKKPLTNEQIQILLNNGVIIIPGEEHERFSHAYSELSVKDIPIFITSDSVLHLFHLEFNEILKNLEIKKLSPMLNAFLDSTIQESIKQYNGLEDKELKELARRNVAYLSVAKKLLDPKYKVPSFVKREVNAEIERIEDHKGFYKSPLFSQDCPAECLDKVVPDGFVFTSGKYPDGEKCSQAVKGIKIPYQGKVWDSIEFYKEVCSKRCYCEDYSQYVPRGHYTASEGLKRYFKAMMWLGRITFKNRGEGWTKQAILLTDAVKSARVEWEGEIYPAYEIWNKIYTITGFFAGASDDLTFYEYDEAVNNVFGYEFNENEKLKLDVTSEIQKEIAELRGPKILGGFEIDLAGNLKDLTQGLRLIGQRYALDSQVLGDLVYKNVGPNPSSPYYEKVLDCPTYTTLSKPKEFYYSCQNMEENRTKYWNEVCSKAQEMYAFGFCGGLKEEELYSVCRFMPTGLDVASVLGSKKASEILGKYYQNEYCNYENKQKELRSLAESYDQSKWTQNLYNTWLWMLQPVLKEKPEGYPNWMRSKVWKLKDLITGLSSWAELRHDTILYVKQSYTWPVAMVGSVGPIAARYYGYVEPNPKLFARAKFAVDYLKKGLEEKGVITEEVSDALSQSSKMMARLREISEKELRGETLTEDDYNYIKHIDSRFNSIIESLASALTIKEGRKAPGMTEETSLEGKEDAFKTSIIADVHTDANTKKVLEVGTGKVDWVLVAHESKDGRIGIAVGPMFSYYEFAWPMKDRLTDEKWRSEVMDEMERPIWYEETNIESSRAPYIVK